MIHFFVANVRISINSLLNPANHTYYIVITHHTVSEIVLTVLFFSLVYENYYITTKAGILLHSAFFFKARITDMYVFQNGKKTYYFAFF